MTLLVAFLAAMAVVGNEMAVATWGQSLGWGRLFLLMLPLHPVTSYAIYYIVVHGSMLDVAIYFSGSTAVLRLAGSIYLGQAVTEATMVAYGLTIAALIIKVGSILLVKP